MKTVKKLTTKKLLTFAVGFVLLLATVFGILFGTHRNAHAQTNLADVYGNMIRNDEVPITTSGPFLNYCDVFDCDAQFPNILDFAQSGYRYVTVEINLQVFEKDEGYQDIFIYKSEKKDEAECLSKIYFSLGGDTEVQAYTYVSVYFASIPLIRFLDDDFNMGLVIRYDTHGKGLNNWYNRGVSINVILSQYSKRSYNNVVGAVKY